MAITKSDYAAVLDSRLPTIVECDSQWRLRRVLKKILYTIDETCTIITNEREDEPRPYLVHEPEHASETLSMLAQSRSELNAQQTLIIEYESLVSQSANVADDIDNIAQIIQHDNIRVVTLYVTAHSVVENLVLKPVFALSNIYKAELSALCPVEINAC